MKRSAVPDDLDRYIRSREARGTRTQTWVAAQMQTTESIVRRIERGDDVRLSTLEKYAQALGKSLHVSVR
jgi:ribosome-binding protein aMBF1 (putative translation factor)